MQKEKRKNSLLKPLPIFCAVVCIGIIIAYSFLIYTNNKQQKILISFLETAFSSTTNIEEFEYSPISKILRIQNLSIYYPNNKNKAITIQDIRTNIPNIGQEPLNIENMTVNGIKLYTTKHDGSDLIDLLKLKTHQSQQYQILINSIDMTAATLFAPDIDVTKNQSVEFTMPTITVGNLEAGSNMIVLSTISNAMAKNIGRVLLKHNLLYKLHDGTNKLSLIKKLAVSKAKTQLELLDKELENSINSIRNNIK